MLLPTLLPMLLAQVMALGLAMQPKVLLQQAHVTSFRGLSGRFE